MDYISFNGLIKGAVAQLLEQLPLDSRPGSSQPYSSWPRVPGEDTEPLKRPQNPSKLASIKHILANKLQITIIKRVTDRNMPSNTHKGVHCFWASTLPLSEGGYKWFPVQSIQCQVKGWEVLKQSLINRLPVLMCWNVTSISTIFLETQTGYHYWVDPRGSEVKAVVGGRADVLRW